MKIPNGVYILKIKEAELIKIQNEKPKTKKKPVDLSQENELPSFFKIPDEVKEEAKSKGLEIKWLNSIQLSRNNGYHRSGWAAYKFEGGKAAGTFGLGVNAEGYVQRGDMIIGARKIELGDQYRKRIANKNAALNRFTKTAADEMRERVRGSGTVVTGYEGDDSED